MTYLTRGILKLDNHDYALVPVENKSHQIPKLRRFDDLTFKDTEEYTYTNLKGSRKKIRLLQLRSGATDTQDIYCELTEADYDNRFHIPTSNSAKHEIREDEIPEGMTEDQVNLEVLESLKRHELEYEALSWCWGTDDPEYLIFINKKDEDGKETPYKLRVREQLALALKYLRHPHKSRTLWIDAICINQDDPSERNHQVQMMSRIYTRAKEVCIWLGDSDSASKLAIPFIKDEIMELRKFDNLCSDKRYTEKWKALMMLMQREWFSRRWVVQEIALANKATIHCGEDSMEWRQFAVAVELFVEVETATHRLSEIMQKDVKFQHVPGWFEYVSDLGASLLVQATGKVFRARRSPLENVPAGETDLSVLLDQMREKQTIDPLDRKSLLSLEYLVSTFFIFGASEPRDAIYSMLALSRDAAPFASASPKSSSSPLANELHHDKTRLMMTTCEPFLEEKPFTVDYQRPYTEVCKDFVSFAIERRKKQDPSQALDILCRPWALPPKKGKSARLKGRPPTGEPEGLFPPLDASQRKWKKRKRDPETKEYLDEWEADDRSMEKYWEDVEQYWEDVRESDRPWKRLRERYFPSREKKKQESGKQDEDMPLPSWVAQASQAPITLDFSPGIEPRITGRSNADPLVGHPQDGHRNYSAAQTKALKFCKFQRRPLMKHYSLFVKGFILEEVEEVMDASQGGNIPKSWLDLAGWHEPNKTPPSEFWRTLVADRGRDNRNPPYYYATACRESAIRGGIASGRVDTAALINNERNSIVAEFCRRVHAVIWNRRLFKTKKGTLGLANNVEKGDKVCILYGCSVPVVLQQKRKSREELMKEKEEDSIMIVKRLVQRMEIFRQRKVDHIARNLSEKQLRRNRRARKKAIRRIKTLDRAKLVDAVQDQDAEERDGSAEDSAEDSEEDDSDDSVEGPEEGPTGQARKNQSSAGKGQELQATSLGDQHDTDSDDSLGSEPPAFQRSETRFTRKKKAAAAKDPRRWYKLRGDCYLHGMMDGEAIREQFHQQIPERTFELR